MQLVIGILLILQMGGAPDPWADSVLFVVHGEENWFGSDFFPQNILGPPDTSARPNSPSSSPQEIFSLGPYGAILLAFTDNVVLDGPGPDLTVFENAFFVGGDSSHLFGEPAFVYGSKDGVYFMQFPFDTSDQNPLNWTGIAGVHPTDGSKDPTDPEVSGGDPFDLADIGLDTLRYLLIADAFFLNWNPMASGFDLDAVVATHWAPSQGLQLSSDPWPDSDRLLAIGANGGNGLSCFPSNVLGPPDSTARDTIPARPEETVTLGDNGFVILKFSDNLVVNKTGPDFTVFENAYYKGGNPDSLVAEPGMVAVSSGGSFFALFPFDTSSLGGLAGITPTHGDMNPRDPQVSGGDTFDLDTVCSLSFPAPFDTFSFQHIDYVLVRDAKEFNRFCDYKTADGFDLDAIVAINSKDAVDERPFLRLSTPQNYVILLKRGEPLQIRQKGRFQLDIFDLSGRKVWSYKGGNHLVDISSGLSDGFYFLRIIGKRTSKMGVLLR